MKSQWRGLFFLIRTAFLGLICVGFGAPQARARDSVENVDVASIEEGDLDVLSSLETLQQNRDAFWACPAGRTATYTTTAPTITARKLHYTCRASGDVEVWLGSHPYASVGDGSYGRNLCVTGQADGRCDYRLWVASRTPQGQLIDAERLARAWTILARAREPQGDTEFQAALNVAPSRIVDEEQLRRVQVQAEAALRGNRNIAAARLYRDALRTAPGWADGHYNLGLIYGDLELYPEAITEMRRYLYLTPSADDARAVQDKIYEWESAMQVR